MSNVAQLTKKHTALLLKIVAATQSPEGLLYVDQKEAAKLVEAGLVELNVEMKDGADNVAARATEQGIQMNAPASTTATAAIAGAVVSAFAIATVALPTAKRGGRTGETYPFDKLEAGQSFFVPATTERPNPAKSLASTVTSANERYSEVIEGEHRTNRKGKTVPKTKQTREFAIRSIEDGAPWGREGVKGAAVFRVM